MDAAAAVVAGDVGNGGFLFGKGSWRRRLAEVRKRRKREEGQKDRGLGGRWDEWYPCVIGFVK